MRNTSLAALSLGILPSIAKTTEPLKPNSPILCDESTEDAYGQGPFYTANAPSIQNDMLADSNEIGTRLILSGQVLNLACSEVIPNTEITIRK